MINLGFGIGNIIGPRAFLNFITGRYHSPVEEKRFVLFVDIAGSTGLAERLGGIAIHRLARSHVSPAHALRWSIIAARC